VHHLHPVCVDGGIKIAKAGVGIAPPLCQGTEEPKVLSARVAALFHERLKWEFPTEWMADFLSEGPVALSRAAADIAQLGLLEIEKQWLAPKKGKSK
jgi:hypothetical protein